MCRMEKHMDIKTYESLLLSWGESTSSEEKMQEWVEMVQSIIGKKVYENIKKDFRDIEEKKKERESGMHCIQSFEKSPTVNFKKDIGAELTIIQDFQSFKMDFSNVLGGLKNTQGNASICAGT